MNKYLRNWLLASDHLWLRDIANRSMRRTQAKRHAEHQSRTYKLLYKEGEPPRVLNGPFAGMAYLNEAVWGSITPRWVGSHESCLWPAIEEIIAKKYSRIIDVGCAEGYYAVGLCRALPECEMMAYDLDSASRVQIQKLWEINGRPGRLSVHGLLTHAELNRLATPGTLLISDIEGGEMQLLNPALCPALTNVEILVEVHQTGAVTPAANVVLLRRHFEASHEIQQFDETMRVSTFDHISHLDPDVRKKLISEGRPYPQLWLWMKARR